MINFFTPNELYLSTDDMKIKNYHEAAHIKDKKPKTNTASLPNQLDFQNRINKAYFSMNIDQSIKNISNKVNFPKQKKTSEVHPILQVSTHAIQAGQNVCFYGFGSKTSTVEKYIQKSFSETHVIIKVDGSKMTTSFISLLTKIIYGLHSKFIAKNDENDAVFNNLTKYSIDQILERFFTIVEMIKYKIIFVFFGLDGPNFLNKESIDIFSRIANQPNINFIATIDSCFFSTSISRSTFNVFSFLFFELNTFEFYREEISYLKSRNIGKLGHNLDTIFGIMESFTPDQRFFDKGTCFVYF